MHSSKQKIFIPFFLLLFFLLQHVRLHANVIRNISTDQWHQLTNDKAFDYVNDIEQYKQPKPYEPGIFQRILQSLFGFFGGSGGAALLWLLLIGTICFILWKLFSDKGSFMFSRTKKKMTEGEIVQEEEDISATNWDALLQQAVKNSDLRLAVRYSYMRLLQLLQQRQLIQYRIDKTNYEYAAELSDTNYKQPFRQLSRQYEYAWYGDVAITPAAYATYAEQFNNVKKQLGA